MIAVPMINIQRITLFVNATCEDVRGISTNSADAIPVKIDDKTFNVARLSDNRYIIILIIPRLDIKVKECAILMLCPQESS